MDHCRDAAAAVREARTLDFRWALLGAYLPVAIGVREAALYSTKLDRPSEVGNPMPEPPTAEKIEASRFGLALLPWEAANIVAPQGYASYFVVKREDFPTRDSVGLLDRKKQDHKSVGRVIGYPKCCRQSYVDITEKFPRAPPEAKHFEALVDHRSNDKPILNRAYFSRGFLPCKPDCREAAKIGDSISAEYDSIDHMVFSDLGRVYDMACAMWVKEIEDIVKVSSGMHPEGLSADLNLS